MTNSISKIECKDNQRNFRSFTFKERVNKKKLTNLLRYDLSKIQELKDKDPNNSINIISFLKSYENDITYNNIIREHRRNNSGYGRFQTVGSSYVTMKKEIRNYLASDFYLDLDIVNCHPVIIYNEFKIRNLKGSFIEQYVENRDKILKEYNITKEDILKCLNTDYEIYSKGQSNDFLKGLNKEFYTLLVKKELKKEYPEIFERSEKSEGLGGIWGSFAANVLQHKESLIMEHVVDFLESEKMTIGCLIHDGCLIEKNKKITDSFLESMKKYVKDKTKYEVTFKIKEMDTSFIDNIIKDDKNLLSHVEIESDQYQIWKKEWEKYFFLLEGSDEIVCDFYENLKYYGYSATNLYKAMNINTKFHDLVNEKNENKDENFLDIWMSNKEKRSYHKLDFLPEPLECPKNIYNLWKGYEKYEEFRNLEYSEKEVFSVLQEYMNHISLQNPKIEKYFSGYIADMLKNPGRKPGVCFILCGVQGTGKGLLYLLLNSLIGKFSDQTGDIDQVFGKFTSFMSKKIAVFLDECVPKDMFDKDGRLKNLITEKIVKIENKGLDARSEKSCVRIFISTNSQNVIKIESSDRRFVVLDIPLIDNELTIKMYRITSDDKYRYLIRKFFESKEIPYERLDQWQANRPSTDIYKEMKYNSNPNYIKFMFDMILDNNKKDFDITNYHLWGDYERFCKENIYQLIGKDKVMKELIKTGIKNINIGSERGKRIIVKDFETCCRNQKIQFPDNYELEFV